MFFLNRLSPLGLFIETKSDLTFFWEAGMEFPIQNFNPDPIEEIRSEDGILRAFIPGRGITLERCKEIAERLSTLKSLLQKHQNEKYEDDETSPPTESQNHAAS